MNTRTRVAAARHPNRTLRPLSARGDGHQAAETARLRQENAQLRQAMSSRAVIDQALGMVMAFAPCGREHAWLVLVEVSQRTNIKLRHVAEALVATTDNSTAMPQSIGRSLATAMHHART